MAQETIQYTGGGLMDISLDTFTSVSSIINKNKLVS